jgi:hypothetical protein
VFAAWSKKGSGKAFIEDFAKFRRGFERNAKRIHG